MPEPQFQTKKMPDGRKATRYPGDANWVVLGKPKTPIGPVAALTSSMVIEPIAFTLTSNGAQSIALNNIVGVPDGVVFFTGGKNGVNETSNARGGMGIAGNDGAGGVYYQTAAAHLKNTTGPFSRTYPAADASATLDGTSGNPVNLIDVTGFSTAAINISVSGADSSFKNFGFAYAYNG